MNTLLKHTKINSKQDFFAHIKSVKCKERGAFKQICEML